MLEYWFREHHSFCINTPATLSWHQELLDCTHLKHHSVSIQDVVPRSSLRARAHNAWVSIVAAIFRGTESWSRSTRSSGRSEGSEGQTKQKHFLYRETHYDTISHCCKCSCWICLACSHFLAGLCSSASRFESTLKWNMTFLLATTAVYWPVNIHDFKGLHGGLSQQHIMIKA